MGVNGSPVSVHPHIVTERSTVHPHIVTEPKDVVGVRVFPERPAAVGSRLVDSGGVGVDPCWPRAVQTGCRRMGGISGRLGGTWGCLGDILESLS